MAAGPVRRAGLKQGDKWPLPSDGKGDEQNAPKNEFTPQDMAYKGTNQQPVTALGKGTVANPKAERDAVNETDHKRK